MIKKILCIVSEMNILYRILFLFLALIAPLKSSEWLECSPTERFTTLTQISKAISGYEEVYVPYMLARGLDDELSMESFFHEDLFNISQALSILFEQDSNTVLHNLFGDHYSLIEGCNTQIDHVGRELYGPISFYLPILEEIAPQLGLKKLSHLVFPSTQVVKVLQEHDPSVKGVTIGRVYFQSIDTGIIRCIELFQASPRDNQSPQPIAATQERISLLTCLKGNSMLTPIDHISIELNTIEEVKQIHNRIQAFASNTLIPYQKEVSHNPGDGSTQTKALMRDTPDTPFNKIVEFVHYNKQIQ